MNVKASRQGSHREGQFRCRLDPKDGPDLPAMPPVDAGRSERTAHREDPDRRPRLAIARWALPLVWSLAVFADVRGVRGARFGYWARVWCGAGQFRFDLPAVAGQPPAGRFGDGSGCRGRLGRADQQWAVAAHRAGEVGDRAVGGAGSAVVAFGQLADPVGFQPHLGQICVLLEGLRTDGGLVPAMRAGATAAHRRGRGPGRRREGGFRVGRRRRQARISKGRGGGVGQAQVHLCGPVPPQR